MLSFSFLSIDDVYIQYRLKYIPGYSHNYYFSDNFISKIYIYICESVILFYYLQ